MNYNKDFIFYLLPAREAFSEYISKNIVETYKKKDFNPIIYTALKNKLLTEANVYHMKDELIKALEKEGKTKSIEKVEKIYRSHMGVSLIYDLYSYSIANRSKRSVEEDKIQKTLQLNNLPMQGTINKKA